MEIVRGCPFCHRSLRGSDLHCRQCEGDVDLRHEDHRYRAAEADFLVAQRRDVRLCAERHGLTLDEFRLFLIDRGILTP